jgi:hypothetical protein
VGIGAEIASPSQSLQQRELLATVQASHEGVIGSSRR